MNKENNLTPENQEQLEQLEQLTEQDLQQETAEAVPAEQDTVEANEQAVAEDTAAQPAEDSQEAARPAPAKQRKRLNRKWRYGGLSLALTAAVIAGVVLLNLIVGILNDRYPFNFDLTKDKQFTLGKESVQIAKEIKEEVNIVVFEKETAFSNPGFGNDLDTVFRQFYEACKQYNLHSGGKVKVTYLDAAANPVEAAKYQEYSPKANDSVLFLSGKRHSIASINDFFTSDPYYLLYGLYVDVQSLVEKTIATNIRKVAGNLQPAVIFTGHGERQEVIEQLKWVLDRNGYEVLTHDLTSSQEIDSAANVAVLAAPGKDFGEEAMKKLREWVENDGMRDHHLVVMVNGTAQLPVLYEYLTEEFGIEVTNDFIVETDNGRYYGNNPYQVFGDAGVVEFTEGLEGKKALSVVTRRLITHQPYDLDKGYYNAQLVTFPSSARLIDLFGEGENAKAREADEYPLVGMAFARKQYMARSANMLVNTYVLVCGSEAFLDANILTSIATADNENLFMTTYNHMSAGDQSVTISGRWLEKERLTVSSGVANWVGIGLFSLGLPLITLAIGLVIFMRRRHL